MKWQNVKHWPDNVCRVNTSCSCIYLCLIAELQTPPKKALAVDKEFWFLLTAKWTKKGVRHRLEKKALFSVGLLIFFFSSLLFCEDWCSVKKVHVTSSIFHFLLWALCLHPPFPLVCILQWSYYTTKEWCHVFAKNMKSFSAGEWRQKPLIYEDVEKH